MRTGIIFLLILSTVILLEIYQNQEISASPLQEYCEYKKSINDSFICPNQPSPSEQQLDVIWYGPETGNYGINFLSHFEDSGLTFEHRALGPIQNLNAKSVFVLFTTTGEKGEMGFTNSEVTNMVNFVKNGGQLILGADTNYAYCLPDTQCAFDFTIEKFGFKFGGDVQRGILVPEENNKEHPIWNSVYQLDSFNDWGFDAYIIDIMDIENIQIVSKVSSQSYNEYTGFTSVQDVPAIIVNENPSFNGGRVIAGGYNMIVGLGNISLLDNILSFVLDRPLEKNEPKKTAIDLIPIEPINTKTNSLKTQIKNGIKPQNISCTGNLQLIFKHDNSPSCVKPASVPKLIDRGWGVSSLEEIKKIWIAKIDTQCSDPWDVYSLYDDYSSFNPKSDPLSMEYVYEKTRYVIERYFNQRNIIIFDLELVENAELPDLCEGCGCNSGGHLWRIQISESSFNKLEPSLRAHFVRN